MPENDVKEIVKAFWASRAEAFDSEPDHVLHSSAQHQAWLGLLGRFADHVPRHLLWTLPDPGRAVAED